MANFSEYWNKVVMKWSGGATFTNDPSDPGGATKYDVTLNTLRQWRGDDTLQPSDVENLQEDEAMQICKKLFWDKWCADDIQNQSIAEILVEWEWGSGMYGIKGPQQVLETEVAIAGGADGHPGASDTAAINNWPDGQEDLFNKVVQAHEDYLATIEEHNPVLLKYKNGWQNRINAVPFVA